MEKKRLLKLAVLCILCMAVISGCSNRKIESALNEIKTASGEMANIDSSEFEFTYSLEDGDENAKRANQKVTGSFQVGDERKVDWVRNIYIAGEDTPRAEQKQEAGTQYQKIEEEKETWIPINENAVGYPPEIEELLNITWKVKDISKVEKEKQDSGDVIYRITFSDDFLKHLKQDRVNSIQKELKRLKKEENFDQNYIDGLEESIKEYQAIRYKEYKAELVIDGNKVIKEYKTVVTTVDGNEKPELISVVTSGVKLDKYKKTTVK